MEEPACVLEGEFVHSGMVVAEEPRCNAGGVGMFCDSKSDFALKVVRFLIKLH